MDFTPLSELKDRREFHEAFQAAMGGAHQNLRALWHFERDQNLPKTYLVEFHPKDNGHANHNWRPEAVFFALDRAKNEYDLSVKKTDDESLLFLSHAQGRERSEFIIDCLNPRFLAFHTLSNATAADRFVLGLLTRYEPEFDTFWLPVQMLKDVASREMVTGWEVRYEPLVDVDEAAAEGESLLEETEEGSPDDVGLGPPPARFGAPG